MKSLFADDIVNNIQNAKFARVMKTYSVRHPQFFILAFSYIFVPDSSLHPMFATVFKYALDMKLIPEEFLLQWNKGEIQFNTDSVMYNKQHMTTLLELVSPFLDWLEGSEGDEESEEEEEEEGEPAVDMLEESKAAQQTTETKQKTEAQLKQEELIAKQLAAQKEATEKQLREQEEKDKAELAAKAAEPRVNLLAAKEEEDDEDFDLDDI